MTDEEFEPSGTLFGEGAVEFRKDPSERGNSLFRAVCRGGLPAYQ
jgi:hypothetical protein